MQPLICGPETVQVLTGWETWFQLPGRSPQKPPQRYKITLLTWLAVFGVSTLLTPLLAPLLAPFPPLLRQFVSIGVAVWLLGYFVMPRLTRLFHRWLYPNR